MSRRLIWHLLLISLAGVLAYSNTFRASFHLDDYLNIVENPVVADMSYFFEPSRARIPLIALEVEVYTQFKTRPIGYFTFALNHALNGLDVRGFHAVNLAIHLTNAALAYLLILITFGTPAMEGSSLAGRAPLVALMAALLFVAHPVQTEAVTYIYQRFASLAATFYLGSLLAYAKWRMRRGGAVKAVLLYALFLLLAVAAMKTKETAFTLPLAVLLYEFTFFRGPKLRRLALLVPVLLTMLIIPLALMDIDKPIGEAIAGATRADTLSHTREEYLFTQPRIVATYLRLLAFPVNLNLDYDYPVYGSPLYPGVLLSIALHASLLGLAAYLLIRARRGDPALRLMAFGVIFFYLALSVESSAIALADLIFEHRLYLPSWGMFAAFSAGAVMAGQRLDRRAQRKLAALLIALPLIMGAAAFARNEVWKTEKSLWTDVIRKSPGKARPHNNLGFAFMKEGDTERALREFQIALGMDFSYNSFYNLGVLYADMGLIDKAIKNYRYAIQLRQVDFKARFNLAMLYIEKGMMKDARRELEAVLRIDPGNAKAREVLGALGARR